MIIFKHSPACAAALVLCLQLQSQTDTLVTSGGQGVPVIITEITSSDIIYRLPDKPDLSLFHLNSNTLPASD